MTAGKYDAAPELNVTGTVSAGCFAANSGDRRSPSGRVLEIHARLGDTVKKGQLLFKCGARTSPAHSPITARPLPNEDAGEGAA